MAEPVAPRGKLDLAAVDDLYQALNERRTQDVVLDLGAVTLLGALCLQVCLATAKTVRAAGNTFSIVNVPDTVIAQMAAMGFTPETLAEGTP